MKRQVYAVIGASFGDEGKGLMTDVLASEDPASTLVIRFNGGAQAGHTVQTAQGRRQVFSHVGSGTLVGAASYLSRYFVSNPWLLDKEWSGVEDLAPRIWADPCSLVTTPFDMLLNQLAEEARGKSRHGSCGVGFNETIERSQDPAFLLRVEDLAQPLRLRGLLDHIRREWVPRRMAKLGLEANPKTRSLLESASLEAAFLESCSRYLQRITPASFDRLESYPRLIFEGAQGLLLDEEHPYFPHVTRSRTGLANIRELALEWDLDEIQAVYVTRWYLTRHGAGPFPTETETPPSPKIRDLTNIPNDWQGSLRFGYLDPLALGGSIQADLSKAVGLSVQPRLALTCLDQAEEELPIWDQQPRRVSRDKLRELLEESTQIPVGWMSWGPDRDSVQISCVQEAQCLYDTCDTRQMLEVDPFLKLKGMAS